jgi:PKD repeat protein
VIRRHPTDPNTIFVGTDGGLWKTTNAGSSYTNLNGNMNMTMFYDVATHPTLDTVMLGGSQDNSSEAYTVNPLWDVVEVTGDGFVNAINRSNTSYCYVASYPSGGPSVYRITGGVNGNYNVVTGAIGDNASWVTPYMLDPVTPDTIYLGTTRIWRSTNRGTSWTSISSTLGGGTMVSLAVGKNDNSVINAGAGSSRVFRSTDTGGSWVDVRGNLPGSHTVNDIEVDPADPLHVYLAISGTTDPNVWYSAAGGTTWTSATNGLPGVTANSVLVVPGPYRIYVGTDIGVFRSDAGDAGPYLPDMAGMALGVAVTDLEHNPTTGTLTAGTWGRGAWQSFATCAPPAADFTGSPTSGTPPLSVTFTDQSTNAPTSWAWDFGDGGTSTSQNPTHVYGAVGTYTVSLTASNSCGADTETKVGYVTVSTCPLPSTDFSGTPTSGTAPLTVAFTDLTSGSPASWSWAFGDGGTSAVQSPTHVYTAPGTYDVSLTTTNACGADTETKLGYITVTGAGGTTEEVVTGAGAGATNAPVVKAWDHAMPPAAVATFTAYGTPQYGANVATADMNGGGAVEIATGPGPGAVYGPQIRGFLPSGSALGKVNFFAYGTLRYGAAVGGGNVDGDAHGEILTGAGPGAVFGPHVRGWNVDAGSATPMAKVSFFAYGTLRYGVRVAGGDVEDDGFAEILTGAGAGSVFAPHVRGFDYDGGAIAALPINVFAFPAGRYGACVGAASTDMDAAAEIVASHGPDPTQGGDVVGYDFTGAGVAVSFAVNAFAALGGAEVAAGDMDGDGRAELVAGAGWGAANASEVRLFAIGGGGGTLLASFPAYPGQSYGTKVAAADTGTP